MILHVLPGFNCCTRTDSSTEEAVSAYKVQAIETASLFFRNRKLFQDIP